jgi:hypothetical protein
VIASQKGALGKQFSQLDDSHRGFIPRQRVFFVASAAPTGRINISPKDAASLRVIDAGRIAYRDLTGSGSEASAHLLADGRLTIMFCAFDGPPQIMRLYGRGLSQPRGSDGYSHLLASVFDGAEPMAARQIVRLDIDLVQTCCGYGVPLFDFKCERESLARWAEAKGDAGLEAYRRDNNALSMDGLPTGLFDEGAVRGQPS